METYNIVDVTLADSTVNRRGSTKEGWAIASVCPNCVAGNRCPVIEVWHVSEIRFDDFDCLSSEIGSFFVEATLSLERYQLEK